MKKALQTILFLAFMVSTFCTAFGQMGKVGITELNDYNKDDSYLRHDCSLELLEGLNPVEIKKSTHAVEIENTWSNGYTGYRISFLLNTELEILSAKYNDWTDLDRFGQIYWTGLKAPSLLTV